jgi:hypothetical protein
MTSPSSQLNRALSLILTVAVTALFSLRSFAAGDLAVEQEVTGTLSGRATVNGSAVQTGATIMSGSTISTSGDEATVDLGPLGRVGIGEHTTIVLTFQQGLVQVKSQCQKTEVAVTRGQVDVRSPRVTTIAAGKEESFDGSVELMTSGGTDFEVECEGARAGAALLVGPGLLGLLALLGVGASVAAAVAIGARETGARGRPSVTPSRP